MNSWYVYKEEISLLIPSFSLIPLKAHEMEGLTQFFRYQRHIFVNNAIFSLILQQAAFLLKLAKFMYLIAKFLP